ncbi:MAG: hypothetical protein BJ554DRAFT_2322 [Olpidium bornovanus]|uniref:Uncharacterized protein n=1 Tax=Olpidium bornovanus TaxID=278681 RepID=A0A8H8A145_9FUNG|nr:MAG: hypothetical protein BJ554DRAFT_2322 [Olpidium bornovanus]
MRYKKENPTKVPLTGNSKANGYGTLSCLPEAQQSRAKSPDVRYPPANGGPYILEDEDGGSLSTTTAVSNQTGLSNWSFFLCSLCLAGVQFPWTVEVAYGSPYLLDLGLSKPFMSLVWLAGPLSGKVVYLGFARREGLVTPFGHLRSAACCRTAAASLNPLFLQLRFMRSFCFEQCFSSPGFVLSARLFCVFFDV